MYTADAIKKRKKMTISPGYIFLAALVLFVFSPVTMISSIDGMVGDTAIQIKMGLDGISSGHMITDEIYSWHEGLHFTAHEEGWYFLVGFMYKILGIWGVILVGTVFNYLTAFTALSYFKDKAHPMIAALAVAATPFLSGFPDYNVRPSVVSTFAITLLIVSFLKDRKPLTMALIFTLSSFALAWLHGGILPVYFVVMAVLIVINILYRRFKDALIFAGSIVAGFLVSLLNPIGIDTWLFGLKQSTATDIWAHVDEWMPKHFSMFEAVVILLVLIGFMTGERVKEFDRDAVTGVMLLSMFFIMTCIYKRFALYFSVAFLIFAPASFGDLLSFIGTKVFGIKKKIEISNISYHILTGACAVMIALSAILYIPRFLPNGTMSDVEALAAYDTGAVDFIRSKGYERIYNSFDTGSWLAFHGIKVHIDNRIDPYMSEFSGVDHVRGKMYIANLSELDSFCEEYDPDAVLLDMSTGYSLLLDQIEKYAPDRYKIVYDNTVQASGGKDLALRWVVIEPVR